MVREHNVTPPQKTQQPMYKQNPSAAPTPEEYKRQMDEQASKAHATRQQGAVAHPVKQELALKESELSWGDQHVDASDIIVPRLYVVNGSSKLAKDQPQVYYAGSIVRSTDKKIITECEFIPFRYTKKWKVEVKGKNKFEHVRFEPFTLENAQRPWEWVDEGKEYRANICVEFFVLMKDDIEREKKAFEALEDGEYPDPDDVMLPTCIMFSRSTYNQGKLLLSHFAKAQSFKLNPAVSTFKLKTEQYANADDTWYGLAIEKSGKSDKTDILLAKKWYDMFDSGSVRVDEAEDEVISPTEVPNTENFSSGF
jgi:hypothetical protein